MPSLRAGPNSDLEDPQPGEAEQIAENVKLMEKLLTRRYTGKPVLRGVHPKDHGCVEATFTVSPTLPPQYQVGVFRKPGETFRAAIRFSNASAMVTPDTPQDVTGPPKIGPKVDAEGKPVLAHGSRGMAVKLYDVMGQRLVPGDHERTQDFLMINQTVFAFANVEDYLALNQAIFDDKELPFGFFKRMFPPFPDAVQERAKRTGAIIQNIKSLTAPPGFQTPPLSPFDNSYFSAAPFGLGEGRVMKFSAKPVNPMTGELGDAIKEPDYLRAAMRKRMAEAGEKDICFDFQIQVRDAANIGKLDPEIENACTEWTDPFITVARIAIPPQDIASPERQEFCEKLFYTPWHGLVDHRPLGGINRLRRDVYTKSAELRRCPVSPDLPSPGRRTRDTDALAEAQRRADRSAGGGLRGRRP